METDDHAEVPRPVDLQKLLSHAQLPALPQSAIRLLELSKNPDNGPAEFALPIEADPGLTGQVLRFVNSSYFGFSHEISSVKLGDHLGWHPHDQELLVVERRLQLDAQPQMRAVRFEKSVAGLASSRAVRPCVCQAMGLKEAEEAFATGLLQDMAVPLLAKELPMEYTRLLGQRDGGRKRLSDLERERFGWTHAEAAGAMARQWKLPQEFATAVEAHTSTENLLAEAKTATLRVAVALSSLLPSAERRDLVRRPADSTSLRWPCARHRRRRSRRSWNVSMSSSWTSHRCSRSPRRPSRWPTTTRS